MLASPPLADRPPRFGAGQDMFDALARALDRIAPPCRR